MKTSEPNEYKVPLRLSFKQEIEDETLADNFIDEDAVPIVTDNSMLPGDNKSDLRNCNVLRS